MSLRDGVELGYSAYASLVHFIRLMFNHLWALVTLGSIVGSLSCKWIWDTVLSVDWTIPEKYSTNCIMSIQLFLFLKYLKMKVLSFYSKHTLRVLKNWKAKNLNFFFSGYFYSTNAHSHHRTILISSLASLGEFLWGWKIDMSCSLLDF